MRVKTLVSYVFCGILAVSGVGCGGGGSQSGSLSPGQSTGRVNVATGSHVLGSADARVTIVEFSDFQCPYCRSFYTDTEPQIIADYVNTGKAKIAYRQYPLASIHQNAQAAAEASECAAKVGGNDAFWSYHNLLFTYGTSNGAGLDVASLKQYAADVHLDTAAFNTCLDNHETAAAVSSDVSAGNAAGVGGTPTFFINGKAIVGAQPYATFKSMIDAEL